MIFIPHLQELTLVAACKNRCEVKHTFLMCMQKYWWFVKVVVKQHSIGKALAEVTKVVQ